MRHRMQLGTARNDSVRPEVFERMESDGSHTAAELIYVGDPMCSWCWGIAPELDALINVHPDVPLRIVVGGLRPGPNAQTVDAAMADRLLHHWQDVEARTGQPFDQGVFDDLGWLYDTEPACRAVVVMRELAPHETFRFFKRIQRAFYAEGQPVWDPNAFEALLDDRHYLAARKAEDVRGARGVVNVIDSTPGLRATVPPGDRPPGVEQQREVEPAGLEDGFRAGPEPSR